MGKLEGAVEKYLKDEVERLGGLCFKFQSSSSVGVPDRVVVLFGHTFFVELKSPTGVTSAIQNYVHKKIRDAGGSVYVVSSKDCVDFLLHLFKSARYAERV